MPLFLLLLALVFSYEVVSFSRGMSDIRHAQHTRVTAAALTTALDKSVTDIESALVATAQSQGGNLTSLPANATSTIALCPVVDAANSTATQCTYSVQRKILWNGLSNAGGATNETIANVNTQRVNGAAVQSDVAVEVDLSLIAANGTTVDGSRTATGHFTLVASCPSAAQCTGGPGSVTNTTVSFNGWKDTNGAHTLAAESLTNGKCAPGSPGCSTVGLDNGGASNVAPGDSRIATQTLCFDSSFAGNGGPNAGDRCNPTGNTAQGGQGSSTYANAALQNAGAGTGPIAK